MTSFHAVLWIDHQTARIQQFDAEHVQVDTLHPHAHPTRTHHSGVRAQHEYFSEVCDSLKGIQEVLVVGPKTGLSDFKHYVDKHRPQLADHLVAFEPLAQLTEGQLTAKAREFFTRYDRMAGIPDSTPTA
jgi:stalled ribosome rescue protein Dom34